MINENRLGLGCMGMNLSSLSSWEDHRFLGNSLGTICQWKQEVLRCYNNEQNSPVEK